MNATRLGDTSSGHDSCAPSILQSSSNNVLINGIGAGRLGDTYTAHDCVNHPTHNDKISSGSSTVFINGRSAARVGDSISIGGYVSSGSINVFIGG